MNKFDVNVANVQMSVAPTVVTTVLDPDSYDKGYNQGLAEGYEQATAGVITLRDTETGSVYSVYVSNGKLMMREIETADPVLDEVKLKDAATSLTYSLYVSSGNLMMKESEE